MDFLLNIAAQTLHLLSRNPLLLKGLSSESRRQAPAPARSRADAGRFGWRGAQFPTLSLFLPVDRTHVERAAGRRGGVLDGRLLPLSAWTNGFVPLRGTMPTECWPVAFRRRYSTAIQRLERACSAILASTERHSKGPLSPLRAHPERLSIGCRRQRRLRGYANSRRG